MSTIEEAAMPISIADIQAHPAEAMAALIETVRRQDGIIQELAARLDQDELHFSRQIAQDRRRIARLEAPEAQPKQKDRREVLLSILVANGGKMPSQEARRLMELPANRFSELLATMRDVIEVKPWRTRSRKYNLIYLRHSSAETGSMPGY